MLVSVHVCTLEEWIDRFCYFLTRSDMRKWMRLLLQGDLWASLKSPHDDLCFNRGSRLHWAAHIYVTYSPQSPQLKYNLQLYFSACWTHDHSEYLFGSKHCHKLSASTSESLSLFSVHPPSILENQNKIQRMDYCCVSHHSLSNKPERSIWSYRLGEESTRGLCRTAFHQYSRAQPGPGAGLGWAWR